MNENDSDFRPGDLVRLKAGGPTMVIAYLAKAIVQPSWCCLWHDVHGVMQQKGVPEAVLVKLDPEEHALENGHVR